VSYVVRPISDRTAFTGKQVDSQFTVTWSQAEQLLLAELRHLSAREIVLELDLPETAIRLDGRPRADARAASPAVRLAFESKQGPLVYATDKFRRPSYRWNKGMQENWQHNVYAIAKSLEALRLVDRYGVTGRGEQYTGFKALGAGRAMPASHMTSEQADAVLWEVSELGRELTWSREARWKKARARAHPDRHNGDRTLWDQVEQAAVVLGLDR
jgi:hypothetical protein